MTSNFLTLTKVHLLGMTGINRVRYSEDGKEKRKAGLFIGLYAFVMILMIAFVCFYAVMFAENGMNDVIPALSFALASAITLIFSLIRGPHMLFAMKDYDMLMSMPVKKSDIVASRLITSYLVNLVFCAVVMIPCAIVYFIYGGFNVAALVYILIAFLLSPVIPLVVSNIIGTLITAATMNLRHKAIFQTALAMVALVGVMALSFLVSYTSGAGSVEISDATLDMLLKIYPPAWLLQQSIAGKGFWYLLVLITASAVFSAAFIAVLARYYLKINSALLSRKSSGRFEAKQLRAGSAFKAMYKNEFARLLSSPSYMLNSTSGLLLLVILSVVSIFFNPFEYLSGIPEFDTATAEQMKFLIVPIVMFTVGITTSGGVAFVGRQPTLDPLFHARFFLSDPHGEGDDESDPVGRRGDRLLLHSDFFSATERGSGCSALRFGHRLRLVFRAVRNVYQYEISQIRLDKRNDGRQKQRLGHDQRICRHDPAHAPLVFGIFPFRNFGYPCARSRRIGARGRNFQFYYVEKSQTLRPITGYRSSTK